jgi:Tol biopolymer transport system component
VDDIFVRDRLLGTTSRVSLGSGDGQANGWSLHPSISGDGRMVAFQSYASNLVDNDGTGYWDVFVRDTIAGTTTRASVSTTGGDGTGPYGPRGSFQPVISADGRYVAFESGDVNLVRRDANDQWDVFVRDLKAGVTSLASRTNRGDQPSGTSALASISADGRMVGFFSDAADVVREDTNGVDDIFVRDRLRGTTIRVSVATDGTEGDNYSHNGAGLSADGRWIAFYSYATNLVPNDTNGVTDIFIRGPLI